MKLQSVVKPEIIQALSDNHAAALASIAENEAWREWYVRERAAWEKAGLRGRQIDEVPATPIG